MWLWNQKPIDGKRLRCFNCCFAVGSNTKGLITGTKSYPIALKTACESNVYG